MTRDLSVELAGLKLANPLMPGSGPPGDSLDRLKRLDAAGMGALVTKTISVKVPRVPRPKIAVDGERFFNVEKWSEKPWARWAEEILPGLADRSCPLLVSLGYSPEDLETLIPRFDPLADGFELSTHYVAADPSLLRDTVKRAKALTRKPVFMKLSWHAGKIAERAALCEAAGADGITAINSLGPALSIDVHKRASRLGAKDPYLWLSGPAIKPLALAAVYEIANTVQIPVIACGGASTGEDVIEFMLAGARAVQTCTALMRKGADLVQEMKLRILAWCEAQGVDRLQEVVGDFTPHYVKPTKTE
jgi:dihydroorotate dehydrogenase subfamily 1